MSKEMITAEDAMTIVDLLSLIEVEVTEAQVEGWTPKERDQAVRWASSLIARANDNAGVRIPPRPHFLPNEGQGLILVAHEPTKEPNGSGRGRGRPRGAWSRWGQLLHTTVRLPQSMIDYCTELGDGTFQEGVRLAIQKAMESDAELQSARIEAETAFRTPR